MSTIEINNLADNGRQLHDVLVAFVPAYRELNRMALIQTVKVEYGVDELARFTVSFMPKFDIIKAPEGCMTVIADREV